ncbi:YceI family protein [Tamlana sp. 2201CG12-4]|uniref:YceI family protein n=1 Tax=Tamlana sp. 2201CG12-4 TaxID=3112582 RepID=UPI002DBCF4F4|nr:YceI family protein [Tamlana sp. 2201CG12-4]MEC3908367.1 YceI family protein [Tamlana sp. 2201CG12-4]
MMDYSKINVLFIILLFWGFNLTSQNKYLTKTGHVSFEASVPSFEEVKAANKSATAIINTDNGQFAALVFVKGFHFKNALMEEHFNENYAESDSYPKATFKGNITSFSLNKLHTVSEFKMDGELNFHGKTKPLKDLLIKIEKSNDTISLSGEFKVLASDFDIKIPKIVSNKIAQDINVSFNFTLIKK